MEPEAGRMRSAWSSLAAGSGTAGLGDKQAVARSRGRGRSLCRDFSRPLIALGVVWCGRGSRQPAGAYSLVKGKSSSRGKRFKLQRGYETWIVPMPAQWCGAELVPEPARRV